MKTFVENLVFQLIADRIKIAWDLQYWRFIGDTMSALRLSLTWSRTSWVMQDRRSTEGRYCRLSSSPLRLPINGSQVQGQTETLSGPWANAIFAANWVHFNLAWIVRVGPQKGSAPGHWSNVHRPSPPLFGYDSHCLPGYTRVIMESCFIHCLKCT